MFGCPIIAKYLRIRPVDWMNHITLRFEVIGCPSKSGTKPFVLSIIIFNIVAIYLSLLTSLYFPRPVRRLSTGVEGETWEWYLLLDYDTWCKNIWWRTTDLSSATGGSVGSGWRTGSSKKNELLKSFTRLLRVIFYSPVFLWSQSSDLIFFIFAF